jgi:hypothetical protein
MVIKKKKKKIYTALFQTSYLSNEIKRTAKSRKAIPLYMYSRISLNSFHQTTPQIYIIEIQDPYMPCLLTAGLLSGALSHSRGNIEIYVFLEKYLHDFRYKNMLRISMALAFDFT